MRKESGNHWRNNANKNKALITTRVVSREVEKTGMFRGVKHYENNHRGSAI